MSAPVISGCALEGDDETTESVDSNAQAVTTDSVVYTDTVPATGWQNWSWSSTIVLGSTDAPLAAGSTSEVKATMTQPWGAFSIAHYTGDLAIADYDSIAFDIRGSSASTMKLFIETLAGTSSGVASVAVPVTTTWTRQTVKLSALAGSLTKLGKINFGGSATGQVIYIDNARVVAKAAASSAPAPAPVSSTYPVAPITVQKSTVVNLTASTGPYSIYVPIAYDATHKTPTKLLLWMHGCGGNGNGETWVVSPGSTQDWVSVSVGGRDGDCWDPNTDVPMVLGALADVKKHLNVDPRRVVIGGYSSGGDIAYRTAFYNAKLFAGLIAENTSPFRDTGSAQAASLAAAAWKFNVVHLAHLQDQVYPIAGVRTETDAVKAAGFPLTRLERTGTHWDNNTGSSGTTYDLRTTLLAYIDAGWLAPQ